MLSTASLLNTSPKTARTRPLLWVWSRKLAGLWTWTVRPEDGLGSTLSGCGTHLKTLEEPLVNPRHSLFLRQRRARISTITSCGERVLHTLLRTGGYPGVCTRSHIKEKRSKMVCGTSARVLSLPCVCQ